MSSCSSLPSPNKFGEILLCSVLVLRIDLFGVSCIFLAALVARQVARCLALRSEACSAIRAALILNRLAFFSRVVQVYFERTTQMLFEPLFSSSLTIREGVSSPSRISLIPSRFSICLARDSDVMSIWDRLGSQISEIRLDFNRCALPP